MKNHDAVAKDWFAGKKARGHSMFTDGVTIWSWGKHFPIATKLKSGDILFNSEYYSSSTRTHQHYVRYVITNPIICNTDEICSAVNNPDAPIIINHIKEHETIEGCVENIKRIFNKEGYKRFPYKKYVDEFKMKLFTHKI